MEIACCVRRANDEQIQPAVAGIVSLARCDSSPVEPVDTDVRAPGTLELCVLLARDDVALPEAKLEGTIPYERPTLSSEHSRWLIE